MKEYIFADFCHVKMKMVKKLMVIEVRIMFIFQKSNTWEGPEAVF